MASQYWDQQRADAYSQFRYKFPEHALRQKAVVVAGGSGGLGAATVALLAAEGANVVVGYRANRARAEELRGAMQQQFHRDISLVEGDLADPEVLGSYLTAVEKTGSPLFGAAIFPGDPARVPMEGLNRETLAASLESNYTGPILLAKTLASEWNATPTAAASFYFRPCKRSACFHPV